MTTHKRGMSSESIAAEAASKQQQESNAKEDLLRVLVESVAALFGKDPHQWSTRPCQACGVVSSLIGRPFGCDIARGAGLSRSSCRGLD